MRSMNSPTDAVLLHLPILAVLAVEDLVCMINVFLEFCGYFPLGIVVLRRRCGDEATGRELLCVGENCLSPPF